MPLRFTQCIDWPGRSLLAAFIFFYPGGSFASCEGQSPSTLLAAWQEVEHGRFIQEVGDKDESEFMLEENGAREGFLYANNVIFSSSQEYNGKGQVRVSLVRPNDQALSVKPLEFAAALRERFKQQNLISDEVLPAGQTKGAYQKALAAVRSLLMGQAGFVKLNPLQSCPYVLKGQSVFATSQMGRPYFLGKLNHDFPGDENTPTNVNPMPICWGQNNNPLLLSFHWVWQCQGEGDVTFVVSNRDRGRRTSAMPSTKTPYLQRR